MISKFFFCGCCCCCCCCWDWGNSCCCCCFCFFFGGGLFFIECAVFLATVRVFRFPPRGCPISAISTADSFPGTPVYPRAPSGRIMLPLVLPKATAEVGDPWRTSSPGILQRWRRLLTTDLQQPEQVVRRQQILLRHDTGGWAKIFHEVANKDTSVVRRFLYCCCTFRSRRALHSHSAALRVCGCTACLRPWNSIGARSHTQ